MWEYLKASIFVRLMILASLAVFVVYGVYLIAWKVSGAKEEVKVYWVYANTPTLSNWSKA